MDGGSWAVISVPGDGGEALTNVIGSASDDVWISGPFTLMSGGTQGWTSQSLPPSSGGQINAGLAVLSSSDIWVGESPAPDHFIDGGWVSFDPGDDRGVNVLWATSANDLWGSQGGVGSPGYTMHWDGTTVSSISPFIAFDGIWAADATDVWGVGINSNVNPPDAGVFFWNGAGDAGSFFPVLVNLTEQISGTEPLHGIWGTSSSDIWAVGDNGSVLHYDGSAWVGSTAPTGASLRSVWGDSCNDFWAVGDNGTIVHFDGSAWLSWSSPTSANLRSVWGDGVGDVWAVGDTGTALLFSPPTTSSCTGAGQTSCDNAGQCCAGLECGGGTCCSPATQACSNDGQCCSGSCDGGSCGCALPNVTCVTATDCCSGLECPEGNCCAGTDAGCGTNSECCSGSCDTLSGFCACGDALLLSPCETANDCCNGNCVGHACQPLGLDAGCSENSDCAYDLCTTGHCDCLANGQTTSSPFNQCCSGHAVGGTCQAG